MKFECASFWLFCACFWSFVASDWRTQKYDLETININLVVVAVPCDAVKPQSAPSRQQSILKGECCFPSGRPLDRRVCCLICGLKAQTTARHLWREPQNRNVTACHGQHSLETPWNQHAQLLVTVTSTRTKTSTFLHQFERKLVCQPPRPQTFHINLS